MPRVSPYRVRMGGESAGGGIVIALAAVLWLVYLMPTWLRRRQYLATERNAVRLQQTLRILAETAEAPSEVRAEANARSIAEQHRALHVAAQRAEAVARAREAAAARALARSARVPREPKQKAAAVAAFAANRLRRGRLVAALLLAVSVAGAGYGAVEILAGGTWLYAVAGALGAFASLGVLQRIATVAAARRAAQAVDRTVTIAAPVQSFVDWQRSEPERPTWTPVPLPKPLYLSRRETADAAPAVERRTGREDVAESLKAAAATAEAALRAAHAAAEVAALPTRTGFAAMGSLDETTPGIIDLNDVLRRRRAV